MADNAATLAHDAPIAGPAAGPAVTGDDLAGDAPIAGPAAGPAVTGDDLAGDVLVEEVSIDGMCGVY